MVEQNKELNIIAQDITANLHRILSSLPKGERLSSIEYNHHQAEWVAASSVWAEETNSIVYDTDHLSVPQPRGGWVKAGEAVGSTIAEAIKNLVEDRAK
jgi:hypothetical protein